MPVHRVKVSSKGQITLPAGTVRAMRARKGTEFLVLIEEDRIVLQRRRGSVAQPADDLADREALAEPAFAAVWDNPIDNQVWDRA